MIKAVQVIEECVGERVSWCSDNGGFDGLGDA
jgi:hypothetical protein